MTDNFLKMGGAPEGYDAALIVKEFEKNPKLHNAKGLDILKRRIDAEYPTGLNVGDSGVVVTELRNLVKSKISDKIFILIN